MNSKATRNPRPSVLYENRFCNQDEFNIVVCGRRNKSGEIDKVFQLIGPDYKTSVELSPMSISNYDSSKAVVSSDVYVLPTASQGYKTWLPCIQKYCAKTKHWTWRKRAVGDLICGFMKIYT